MPMSLPSRRHQKIKPQRLLGVLACPDESSVKSAVDTCEQSFWKVRALRETRGSDTIVSVGDFYQHQAIHMLSGGKWSDDKRFYAFTAENFERKEIWVVGRDGTGLRRLLCLEALPSAGIFLSGQELQVLDWDLTSWWRCTGCLSAATGSR